jgi:hypothetical protein
LSPYTTVNTGHTGLHSHSERNIGSVSFSAQRLGDE